MVFCYEPFRLFCYKAFLKISFDHSLITVDAILPKDKVFVFRFCTNDYVFTMHVDERFFQMNASNATLTSVKSISSFSFFWVVSSSCFFLLTTLNDLIGWMSKSGLRFLDWMTPMSFLL